jgi:hypothetical protein
MIKIMSIKRDAARLVPESHYATPEDLLAELGMTAGEKRAALERWLVLLRGRLESASEGMIGPEGTNSEDADLLRRVNLAIARLS